MSKSYKLYRDSSGEPSHQSHDNPTYTDNEAQLVGYNGRRSSVTSTKSPARRLKERFGIYFFVLLLITICIVLIVEIIKIDHDAKPKSGSCPLPKDVGVCIVSCSVDKDCSFDHKCCSNVCGRTCKQPLNGTVIQTTPLDDVTTVPPTTTEKETNTSQSIIEDDTTTIPPISAQQTTTVVMATDKNTASINQYSSSTMMSSSSSMLRVDTYSSMVTSSSSMPTTNINQITPSSTRVVDTNSGLDSQSDNSMTMAASMTLLHPSFSASTSHLMTSMTSASSHILQVTSTLGKQVGSASTKTTVSSASIKLSASPSGTNGKTSVQGISDMMSNSASKQMEVMSSQMVVPLTSTTLFKSSAGMDMSTSLLLRSSNMVSVETMLDSQSYLSSKQTQISSTSAIFRSSSMASMQTST